jgi:class 3 adenylate cyclase
MSSISPLQHPPMPENCLPSPSARSCGNLSSTTSSLPRSGSFRLTTHAVAEVTILFIDIKGFTAQCAASPAGRVGAWVADFYAAVADAAAAHGVTLIETRGDCCVCVVGAEGAVPARAAAAAAADPRADQATRTLAFASALHRALAALPAAAGGGATAARMGAATGAAAVLIADDAGAPFASLMGGDAAAAAARLESLAAAGQLLLHRSTADRWARETGRAPPASAAVECAGGVGMRAAAFDCAAGAFLPAGPGPAGRVCLRRLNSVP